MKPKVSEHALQQLFMNYLTAKGYYVMRLNSGKFAVGEGASRRFIRGQDAGTPDLLCIKKGKALFVEVKVGSNKLTIMQEQKIKELAEYGCKTIVAYSIEDLQEGIYAL